MVIYIDILVILNTFINFLLMLGASAINRKSVGKTRLFLSALFGGAYSLVLLLPDTGKAISVLIRLVGAVVMTLIAFGFKSGKEFLKSLGCVCFVSFSFAGAMLTVYLVFRPDKMAFNNSAVYFDISVRFFVLCAVICFIFIKLLAFLLKRFAADNTLCRITVEINRKNAVFKGLVDTGNSLTDVFTNKPVTTVEKRVLKRIIPDRIEDEKRGVVPVKTALGTGILPLIRADRMVIEFNKKRYEIMSPLIALSEADLSDGEYGALVNPSIFEFGSIKNEIAQDNK